ncbi:MAG: hypothetical protein ACKN9M_03540, partial [Burkholderiaceae bacterium]
PPVAMMRKLMMQSRRCRCADDSAIKKRSGSVGTTPEMLSKAGVGHLPCPPSETRWTAMVRVVTRRNPMLSWHEFMWQVALDLTKGLIGSQIALFIQHTNRL